GLEVTVKNAGTAHALLSNPSIQITADAGIAPIVFSGDAAAGIEGQNILALPERTFFVYRDTAVTGTTYATSIAAEIE
ncbi:MAG: hypothetical protein LLF89_08005, partial [Spirochaetaceae bacterium]|nr:hypothetical protein [Spirochaetaceae bacterium]